MGPLKKPVTLVLFLVLALACPVKANPPGFPDGLPPPPPLPPEVIEKRPLEPPPELPDPSELFGQLKQLEELLSLTPEKLGRLRQTIEFIEKMSGDEREAMRIRLSQVTQATPELRLEISKLANLLSPDLRSGLSQFWLASSDSDRETIRTQFADLSNEAKSVLLEQKVLAFIERRDEVFKRMKASLQNRLGDSKQSSGKTP